MITIPLMIGVATVVSLIQMLAYHLNLPYKLKTDSLINYLTGMWTLVLLVTIYSCA